MTTTFTKERTAELKAVGDDGLEEGQFKALISVFNTIDTYGDVVMPGAFTKSLEEWTASGFPLPVIWSHQWSDIWSHIGGSSRYEQTEKGLVVVGDLDLDNPTAVQAYRLMKSGRITQFSFGFDVIDGGWGVRADAEGNERDVYELRELKLHEVGPCLVGVNRQTELQGIKGEPPKRETSAAPRRAAGDAAAPQQEMKAAAPGVAQLGAWITLTEMGEQDEQA